MKRFKFISFVVLISCIGALGCGKGESLELVAASGTVMLDEKPVAGVAVTLIPQDGVMGRGGYATSGVDGTFALQAEPEAIGVAAGTYRVLLQKYAMPDGSPVPPGTSAADANLINQLPAVYSHPERSPLSVTIPIPDGQALSFKMSSSLR